MDNSNYWFHRCLTCGTTLGMNVCTSHTRNSSLVKVEEFKEKETGKKIGESIEVHCPICNNTMVYTSRKDLFDKIKDWE